MIDRVDFKIACNRVWNAADEHGLPLHIAMGFFTAMDWQQIATREITDAGLNTVMKEIAGLPYLREQIQEEQR